MQADAVHVGASEDFRLTIKKISDDLGSDEISTLKYLCNDNIPSKRLEEVKSGLDLFEILCNKNLVTAADTRYLAECLYMLQRMDLLRLFLLLSAADVKLMLQTNGPQLDQFRVMIMNVIECMDSGEVRNLAFCLDNHLPKKHTKYKSGYTLLLALERSGELGPDNLELLESMVKQNVEDEGALELIQHYRAERLQNHPSQPPPNGHFEKSATARGAGQQVSRCLPAEKPGQQPLDNNLNTAGEGNEPTEMPSLQPQPCNTEQPLNPPKEVPIPGGDRERLDRSRLLRAEHSSQKPLDDPPATVPPKSGAYGAGGGRDEVEKPSPGAEGGKDELELKNPSGGSLEPRFPSPREPKQPIFKERVEPFAGGATGGSDKDDLTTLKNQQENDISSNAGATAAACRTVNADKKNGLFVPPDSPWESTEKQNSDVPLLPTLLDEAHGTEPVQVGEVHPGPADTSHTEDEDMEGGLPSMLGGFTAHESDEEAPPPTEAADEDNSIHEPPTQNDISSESLGDNNPMPSIQNFEVLTRGDYVPSQTVEEMEQELIQLRQEVDKQKKDDNDMPSYKIKSEPRGQCIIINNVEFFRGCGGRKLNDRHGSDVDQGNLHYIFKKLKFEVKLYRNLTRDQIMEVVRMAAHLTDHSEYDCFVFCLLTHGSKGSVYGVDGLSLDVLTITENFKGLNCPSLQGKPKLFFIQACQGSVNQMGFSTSIQTDSDNYGETPSLLPNETDFLVGYATLPGFVSYRSETHGSWYITMLVEMLDKHSDRHDLLSIMVKVNEEVSKASALIDGGIYKQSPMPLPTLRKKVYLKTSS